MNNNIINTSQYNIKKLNIVFIVKAEFMAELLYCITLVCT